MGWEYDPNLSRVEFAIGYLGIAVIRGRFMKVQASVNLDDPDPTHWSVEATVQAASLFSGHEAMDDHVRSPDFIDVERFPTINFKSKQVDRSNGGYRLTGDLSLHGVTREVALTGTYGGEATDARGRTRRGFSAQTTITRKDFDIKSGVAGDRSIAGEEIRIGLEIVFNKTD